MSGRLIGVVGLLAAATGATGVAGSGAPAGASPGPVPGAEWTVVTPESQGMDAAKLDGAREYAFQSARHTQSVVVVRGGQIVGEWYAPGSGPDSWVASWSMAKSFTSALIGIALDEGLIPSVDEPMTTYYPAWAGTSKEHITLRDVLHMESGLDWDEDYDPSALGESEIIAMVGLESDQLAYAAGIGYRTEPGTAFNYSSGDTMLLSGVIEQATGRSAEDYAHEKLLDPIGIDQVEWWQDAEGHTLTYCCFDTTSRDFARFGLLYLHQGAWGAEQVVPSAWVDASVTDTATTYDGYGYQWWLDMEPGAADGIPPYYSAQGHDGQNIFVIPSLDLVVVRNGTYVKSPCPPVADPALLPYYPPSGLVPGQGTRPPESWNDRAFLAPIVASITGDPAPEIVSIPAAEPDPPAAEAAACPGTEAPVSTTTPTTAVGVLPVVNPRFTG